MKFLHQDVLVPGPFTISASLANASRELCDGVHQQWDFSLNINKVNLGDQISSVSFVHHVASMSKHLEEATVTTLGLKNMHRDILMSLYVSPGERKAGVESPTCRIGLGQGAAGGLVGGH